MSLVVDINDKVQFFVDYVKMYRANLHAAMNRVLRDMPTQLASMSRPTPRRDNRLIKM